MSKQHALYRFYDQDDQLLYVGISVNPGARMQSHSDTKHWWHSVAFITIEKCHDLQTAHIAEKRAIEESRPRYNVVHNTGCPPEDKGKLDITVMCHYCKKHMIRYWDDDPQGCPNQCPTCNEIMCNAADDLWVRWGLGV